MRLTVYGKSVVYKMLLVTLLIDAAAILIPIFIIKLILLIISVLLIAFTLYFFRDPVRNVPILKDDQILSPGDGKVMLIEEIIDNEYLNADARLIGVFLSPFNVHVNRFPVSGMVEYFKYIKGEYIMAFNEKSSERNERSVIGINTGKNKILFKQIAGFVARRIVCNVKIGDKAIAGDKFGMIKFGSRLDIIIPRNSVVNVSIGQKLTGGETIIAELK